MTNRKKLNYFLLWYGVIAVLVLLDQVVKYLTVRHLAGGSMPLIEGVLHFTYVENRGAAFGILSDHRWIYMTVSGVATVVLSYILYRLATHDKLFCISLLMIIGGGIGNMIDRIFRGFVVDMIDVRLIHFAVFNVADICICVGAALMAVYLIFFDKTLLREQVPIENEPSAPREDGRDDGKHDGGAA